MYVSIEDFFKIYPHIDLTIPCSNAKTNEFDVISHEDLRAPQAVPLHYILAAILRPRFLALILLHLKNRRYLFSQTRPVTSPKTKGAVVLETKDLPQS